MTVMAVLTANIAVGDFYVCFTEVREVISVARSGDVTFLARSRSDVVGREIHDARHTVKRAVCD